VSRPAGVHACTAMFMRTLCRAVVCGLPDWMSSVGIRKNMLCWALWNQIQDQVINHVVSCVPPSSRALHCGPDELIIDASRVGHASTMKQHLLLTKNLTLEHARCSYSLSKFLIVLHLLTEPGLLSDCFRYAHG
jgi:hypothetical protein